MKIHDLREAVKAAPSLSGSEGLTPGLDLEEIQADFQASPELRDERLDRIFRLTDVGKGIPLTLQDIRKATLANNLELQGILLGPEIAKQMVRKEEARFESTFTVGVQNQKTVQPSYNAFGGGGNFTVANTQVAVVPSLMVPLRTGGAVSLDWTLGAQISSNENPFGQPTNDVGLAMSAVSVKVQQPLLKNAGVDVNESMIVIAQAREGEAEAMTQYAVIQSLLQTEVAYWSLYRAWKGLEISREIYEYSKRVLDESRRLVDAGLGSISSVYTFEVSVARTVSAMIAAEEQVNLAVRGVKKLIQDPSLSLETSVAIIPETEPVLRTYEFDNTALVSQALANRGDLLAQELKEVQSAIEVLALENQLLPSVNLAVGYTFNGFDSTSSSISTARQDMFDTAFSNDIQNGWSVGVNASIPIGNEAAKASYQAALLQRLKVIADTNQREIMVTSEVLDSIDRLQSDWDQILVTRYEVAAAQRSLDLAERLFELGEQTSTDVVVAIRGFAQARQAMADADASYQVSMAQLTASIGCVLGYSGIEWKTLSELERLQALESQRLASAESVIEGEAGVVAGESADESSDDEDSDEALVDLIDES